MQRKAPTLKDVLAEAGRLIYSNKCAEAIEFLKSSAYYKEDLTHNDLQLLELLGMAYGSLQRGPEDMEQGYKIWWFLFSNATKKLKENSNDQLGYAGVAINALYYMIQLTDVDTLLSPFLEQALTLITKYPAIYATAQKRNYRCYELCFNAALKSKFFAGQLTHLNVKNQKLQKAIEENLKRAFAYAPDDSTALKALLYLAQHLLLTTQSADVALEHLLKHEKKFAKYPDYHYALHMIYLRHNEALSKKHDDIHNKLLKAGAQSSLKFLFSCFSLKNNFSGPLATANAKYYESKYDEAIEILTKTLATEPNNLAALELAAIIEETRSHPADSMEYCEKVLALNPGSFLGMTTKARCLWKFEQEEKAVALCEAAYQAGCRRQGMFQILMAFYSEYGQEEKFLVYALENVKTMPSASLYQKIGMAHYQLAQYELALEAFKKARKLDVNYNTDQIALGITFCSFQLAGTVEQHRKCAKKLACYFSSLGKKSPQPGALRLVEELNTLGFSVPMGHENLAHETPSEKPDEATSKSLVPPEIKEKIIAAMQNPFFWADLPMDREQPSTEEYKLDPKEFVPINESGTLKGKISHKVALSVEERNKFQTALETGRLLPANSKGISGVKRKGNDLYIKISRSGLRLFAKKYFSYQDTESNQLVRMANFDRLKRKHS